MRDTHKKAYYQKQIEQAKDFKDMVPTAIEILNEMWRKNIIQICGPISTGGLDCKNRNLGVLAIVIKHFEDQGYFVFDQLFFEGEVQRIWNATTNGYPFLVLEEFYRPVFETGKIKHLFFLPFWATSIGANFEMDEANRLEINKTIISWTDFFEILKNGRG